MSAPNSRRLLLNNCTATVYFQYRREIKIFISTESAGEGCSAILIILYLCRLASWDSAPASPCCPVAVSVWLRVSAPPNRSPPGSTAAVSGWGDWSRGLPPSARREGTSGCAGSPAAAGRVPWRGWAAAGGRRYRRLSWGKRRC